MPKKLLTSAELADFFQVGKATITRWARQGRIPAVRANCRVLRFDPEAALRAMRGDSKRERAPCK